MGGGECDGALARSEKLSPRSNVAVAFESQDEREEVQLRRRHQRRDCCRHAIKFNEIERNKKCECFPNFIPIPPKTYLLHLLRLRHHPPLRPQPRELILAQTIAPIPQTPPPVELVPLPPLVGGHVVQLVLGEEEVTHAEEEGEPVAVEGDQGGEEEEEGGLQRSIIFCRGGERICGRQLRVLSSAVSSS